MHEHGKILKTSPFMAPTLTSTCTTLNTATTLLSCEKAEKTRKEEITWMKLLKKFLYDFKLITQC